jgi:CubicO group peptidase (beta-lactamase class C family)
VDLFTHTAGLVADDLWADRMLDISDRDFTQLIETGIPLVRQLGEEFEYSNLGYNLVGRAIAQASGRRYQDYITASILRPLGMKATVWDTRGVPGGVRALGYSWRDDHLEEERSLGDGAFGAAAGLSSSASDFARYVVWILSAWQRAPSGHDIINRATIREAARGSIFSQMSTRTDGPEGKPCPVVWMYGYGFYVVTDCELGVMLRHPGGLPGYGAQLLLLPHEGVGLFAFANLTYAHLWEPTVAAAVRLKRAGLLAQTEARASSALEQAAHTVLRIYEAADVAVAKDELAANVLLDRSRDSRNSELKSYRARLGDCESVTAAHIQHPLAGRYDLHCAEGTLQVTVLLSPTVPSKIQYLDFATPPPP